MHASDETFDQALHVVRLRAVQRRIARAESPRPQRRWRAIDHDTLDELRAEAASIVMLLVADHPRGGEQCQGNTRNRSAST